MKSLLLCRVYLWAQWSLTCMVPGGWGQIQQVSWPKKSGKLYCSIRLLVGWGQNCPSARSKWISGEAWDETTVSLPNKKPDGTWSSQVPPETRRDQQKVGDLKSDSKESSPGPMEITEAKPNHLAFVLLKLLGVLGISNLKGSCFSKLEGPQPSSIAGLSEKWWRPGGCDLQGGKYNDCG